MYVCIYMYMYINTCRNNTCIRFLWMYNSIKFLYEIAECTSITAVHN